MAVLLRAAAQTSNHRAYVGRLLAVFPDSSLPSTAKSADKNPVTIIHEQLSQREHEVLRLIAEGCTNKEIALKLHVSVRSVKYYTTGIYTKLDVKGRAHAVAVARELGILA